MTNQQSNTKPPSFLVDNNLFFIFKQRPIKFPGTLQQPGLKSKALFQKSYRPTGNSPKLPIASPSLVLFDCFIYLFPFLLMCYIHYRYYVYYSLCVYQLTKGFTIWNIACSHLHPSPFTFIHSLCWGVLRPSLQSHVWRMWTA